MSIIETFKDDFKRVPKVPWRDGYSEFKPPVGKVFDRDVAKYVKKHSRFIDRLNTHKNVVMTFMAFDILNGSLEEPVHVKKGKNWKFFPDIF